MNKQLEHFYEINRLYVGLRDQLMDTLTDNDLQFRLPGANKSLGELCRKLGETQHAYVQSFKTFQADFSYRNEDTELARSVQRLKDWYQELDDALKEVLENITDDDAQNRQIIRGENLQLPTHIHLDVFREALLLFYGKVDIYLKAMEKKPPDQWQMWIG
jgi:hypothetical protein